MARRLVLTFLLPFALTVACDSSGVAPDSTPETPEPTDTEEAPALECPEVGAIRCEGTRVVVCEESTGGTSWGAPKECPEEQSCRNGGCRPPTKRMRSQAASVGALIDALAHSSAWHLPVDADAVREREHVAVLRGDGTDATFFGAAWRAMNAFPQGHQGMYAPTEGVCGESLPYQHTSRFGVCGRPAKDGIAITTARIGNVLGLRAGDVIVRAGDDEGEQLFEAAYARAVCGYVFPSRSGRRFSGATSFFGTVPAGTKLLVRGSSGSMREVIVPEEHAGSLTDCTDPFGRNRRVYAEATTRSDGVVVIRLPSFYPWDGGGDHAKSMADFREEVIRVFESVKEAPAIVWDTRGNTGGYTLIGLEILGGVASARDTAISYCRTRTPGSSPVSFETDRYAVYKVEPGGSFAYDGKVAIVTDGLAYSAGDYFAYAAQVATDVPVVGAATAGAFGGGNGPIPVDGPPKLEANYDPSGCFSASTDAALEAAPLEPTIAIDYDPADLVAGIDTVLERAVQEAR